ncbi:MAG: hypothetical protein JW739_05175 [Opitutales bacterium]|nr:hypothetical protein [Opitutales bacterium]
MTEYFKFSTESGVWLHGPDSNLAFAFIQNSWSEETKENMEKAFVKCTELFPVIIDEVEKTTESPVVNGLYLLNKDQMIKVMNSIQGMGQTSAQNQEFDGYANATTICKLFFNDLLSNLGGDVTPMMNYLVEQMRIVQEQAEEATIDNDFGILVGIASLMPVLEMPITTFVYISTQSESKSWFVSLSCLNPKKVKFSIKTTVVKWNYNS